MVLLLVLVFLVVATLVLRTLAGAEAPHGIERVYVALSPVPIVVGALLPAVFLLAFGGLPGVWTARSAWTGVALSVALGAAGVLLIARAVARRARWGWPLGAAVVLAATPGVLVAVSWGLLARR